MILSIFDWSGTLLDDVKADEEKFGIKLEHVPGGVMGFETFKISGPEEKVSEFLEFYDLEAEEG